MPTASLIHQLQTEGAHGAVLATVFSHRMTDRSVASLPLQALAAMPGAERSPQAAATLGQVQGRVSHSRGVRREALSGLASALRLTSREDAEAAYSRVAIEFQQMDMDQQGELLASAHAQFGSRRTAMTI